MAEAWRGLATTSRRCFSVPGTPATGRGRRRCSCVPGGSPAATPARTRTPEGVLQGPETRQTGHDADHDPQFGKTTLISERDFPKPRIMPPQPGSLVNPRGVREGGQAPACPHGRATRRARLTVKGRVAQRPDLSRPPQATPPPSNPGGRERRAAPFTVRRGKVNCTPHPAHLRPTAEPSPPPQLASFERSAAMSSERLVASSFWRSRATCCSTVFGEM